jgi:hypothetical protein
MKKSHLTIPLIFNIICHRIENIFYTWAISGKLRMKGSFRIALGQMSSVAREKEANLNNVENLLESEPWDYVVLSELFATDFFPTSKDPNLFCMLSRSMVLQ